MIRGGVRLIAPLLGCGLALSAGALEVRTTGKVPCQGLAALGPAIEQRLGPEAAALESGLRLRVQARSGQRLHVALLGGAGQVLFDRTAETGTLSCEDLVASLSLLASIWVRQTSTLDASVRSNQAGALRTARRQSHPPDAGPTAADAGGTVDAGPPNPGAPDAGPEVDAGAVEPLVADAGPDPDADAGVSLRAGDRPVDVTDPWSWSPHWGLAATAGIGVGDDLSLTPAVLGLRGNATFTGLLRAEVEATWAAAYTDSISPGSVRIQPNELAARLVLSPLRGHPHLHVVAGPILDLIDTRTSGYPGAGTAILWNGGGQLGARWTFPLTERLALDVGILADLRAFRDVLQITRPGSTPLTVATLPPVWVFPGVALEGDDLF